MLPDVSSTVEKSHPSDSAAAGQGVPTSKVVRLPRRNLEREFLPAALEIIDTPASPVGRILALCIVAMAVAAIVWACVGKVDIIATASGRIVAQGKTKVVQPVETGIVRAIHVADGDHVKAGDVLIELDHTQAEADRDRFRRDLLQARLDLSRLQALANQLSGQVDAAAITLIDPPKEASPTEVILAKAAMGAQLSQQAAKLADIDQQISGKQSEAAEAEATIEKFQASLPMVEGQEQIRRELKDKEYGNKLAWYQANQQLIEQSHEIKVETDHERTAMAAMQALQQQRLAAEAEYKVNVLQDLEKTHAQISELEAELIKADDHVRQSTLAAPIDGTVQQVTTHTIGGVVTSAEALMSIVPDQDILLVEATVQNKDVGFVHAGQEAHVKVDAFNFTRYGLIDGTVIDVTRDAVQQSGWDKRKTTETSSDIDDVQGEKDPVYVARISLKANSIETENGMSKLGSGMQVSAEVRTGRRSIIDYLLSPMIKHIDESLRER